MLATRSTEGVFQAFVNSCRHRGALVETRPSGNDRRFTCPFHAWSYNTAGTLVGLPKAGIVEGFSRIIRDEDYVMSESRQGEPPAGPPRTSDFGGA